MSLPRSVQSLAARRFGVLRTADLQNAGLSVSQVKRLVRQGDLVRVHPGIHRLASTRASWEQRQLAACYAAAGVASHRAAARLWGVEAGLLGMPGQECWPAEVSVARRNPPRPQGVVVHRAADLQGAATASKRGIPVTTPQRMLVDLGAVVLTDVVARAVEHCVATGLLSIATIEQELRSVARRGRPGVQAIRQVLADWPVGDQQLDSVLELAFARLCRNAGLPEPVFQFPVKLAGRRRRVDFAYPDRRLVIEVDGFGCRTDRRVFQDERWRQNDLIRAGWKVLRFTWHDITQRPDYVADTIRACLSKAA